MTTEPTADDRLGRALRSIIREQFPQLVYLGLWEYAVQSVHGTSSVDAKPVDETIGLPDLVGLPIRPSVLGEQVTPAVGSVCIVAFVNADPTRPMMFGGDPSNPPTLSKLAGGGKGVARTDDAVNAGYLTVATAASATYYPATIAGLAAANAAVAGSSGGLVLVSLTSGKVTGGSTKVEAG